MHRTILVLSTMALSKPLLAANPLPKTPDHEHVTVTGTRVVPEPVVSIPRPGIDTSPSIGGGGSTLAERNANGKRKAEEKKSESDAGLDDFWNVLKSIWNKGEIRKLLKGFSMPVISGSYYKVEKTFHPNGQPINETTTCLEIAVQSNNESNCAKITIQSQGEQIKLEINKLVNRNGRLAYTTDDTIVLEGSSIQDIQSILNEIDPNQFN